MYLIIGSVKTHYVWRVCTTHTMYMGAEKVDNIKLQGNIKNKDNEI